ncbi:hypothetical protein GcM3_091026, partial [Golovinomyces cichoracearum]
DECFYLNFKNTKKPASFKFKKEVFDKINQKLKAAYMGKVRAYVTNKLDYDPKLTPNLAMKKSDSLPTKEVPEEDEYAMQMGSFINHLLPCSTSSFSVNQSPDYHLLRHWVLDGGSDIHICNKSMYHLFTPDNVSTNDDKVVAGVTEYKVESWGTCRVNIKTPIGNHYIMLKRTAFIPEFMTSLVALSKLTKSEVHWSSRYPNQLENSDGSIFCFLFKSGEHIVFEPEEVKTLTVSRSTNSHATALTSEGKKFHPNSSTRKHKTLSKTQLHRILGHPSPEVVEHVADVVRDGNITILDDKPPKTVECSTCALSKSHQVISRSSEKEHPENHPFERITIDLIPMKEGYNSNTQIIHFQCSKTLFNMVFTMHSKFESPRIVKKVLNLVSSMNYKQWTMV